jgi:hypothetical protein
VLAAIGATGAERESPVNLPVGTLPDVGGPDEAERWGRRWHQTEVPKIGWLLLAEMRQVEIGDNRFAVPPWLAKD